MNAYLADSEQNSYFSKYGKDFQERIFQALLTDHTWASQMMEVMTAEYFEIKYLQYLGTRFFGFHHKYKNFPTRQLLVSIIREELTTGNDIILREQVIEFLSRLKTSPNLGDLKYDQLYALHFLKRDKVEASQHEVRTSINSKFRVK